MTDTITITVGYDVDSEDGVSACPSGTPQDSKHHELGEALHGQDQPLKHLRAGRQNLNHKQQQQQQEQQQQR